VSNDVETMFYEYVIPCIVMSVLLWFVCVMVGKGLDQPEQYTLTEEQRASIVESWDN